MQQWETPSFEEMKRCSNMQHLAPLSAFEGEKRTCTRCRTRNNSKKKARRAAMNEEQAQAYFEKMRPKWVAERTRAFAQNPKIFMLNSARFRARQKNVPFAITGDEFVIPENCPVLGMKLERGYGKIVDSSPSLDRIVPALGYVKGNVAVISQKANQMKSNGTAAEHEAIAKWIRANGGE